MNGASFNQKEAKKNEQQRRRNERRQEEKRKERREREKIESKTKEIRKRRGRTIVYILYSKGVRTEGTIGAKKRVTPFCSQFS